MTTATAAATLTKAVEAQAAETKKKLTTPWASIFAVVVAVLWTLPTFGLAISSLRPAADIRREGWWKFFGNPEITFANYDTVLNTNQGGLTFKDALINTIVITLPAVLIPLVIAGLAAYAFAWVDFPLKNFLFVLVFALQIVPIQVALLPLLKRSVDVGIAGTFWPIWIAHSAFALPLAIFLLHNFMREIPRELIEAARVDGAGHVTILLKVLLPLLKPALAAFAIFQFLWVWNDLLVALTFAGGENAPATAYLANLAGTRGTAWHLLTAGAMLSIIVPVIVFLSMQRYFVRGLLAGGLKG